jgi:hypothetical protein
VRAATTTKGKSMNVRRLGVLLVAVLALVAAGCGGGGSNEASSDTSTAVSDMTTEETTATTDEMTTTESSSDASGVDTTALTGQCAQLAGLGSKIAQALGGQDANVQDVSSLFDEVADQVPDEIKADWQVLADNFSKIADALKGTDLSSGATPDAETLAKLQKLTASLDSPQVRQASAHIEAWAKKNC